MKNVKKRGGDGLQFDTFTRLKLKINQDNLIRIGACEKKVNED